MVGHVRFLLQIESARARPRLHDIAGADLRVMGMMLGSEDFSLDCGARRRIDWRLGSGVSSQADPDAGSTGARWHQRRG